MFIVPTDATDFYKYGHIFQYPKGTTFVYSNVTARSDKLAIVLSDFDHKVVVFGIQAVCQWMLIDFWNACFFNQPKEKAIDHYRRMCQYALNMPNPNVSHFEALHDLGYLPIKIKTLAEGSRVDIRVPFMTIQNTHPDFYWLTNFLETAISAETWKSITTATTAYEYRRLFEKYAKYTGTSNEHIPYQGHDFSARGMSGIFDAASSGAAHLAVFSGTDTPSAISYIAEYYDGDFSIGGSIPATEHSVSCLSIAEVEASLVNSGMYEGLTIDQLQKPIKVQNLP